MSVIGGEHAETDANLNVKGATEGIFDGLVGTTLCGWAFDRSQPDHAVGLEIWVDGAAVGNCIANEFREDLLAAGLGSGHHSFRFKLRRKFLDGKKHKVEIRDADSAAVLSAAKSIVFPESGLAARGEIERLDDAFLVGWVSGPDAPIDLSVLEAGKVVATDQARDRRVDGTIGFSIRLPPEVCDGLPHAFVVEADEPFAAIAVVTPYLLTPHAVLAEYASTALPGPLAFAASYRYQALAEQMGRLPASADAAAQRARDLSIAHSFLVNGPKKRGVGEVYESFSFPAVDQPAASILIPVHNKFSFTYRCLASLLLMPNRTPFEVLVLDDGSSDETAELESIVGGIRIVRHKTALGFLRNCNDGGKHANGRYIVLLNNDTEVTPHWLDRLIRPFDLFDDVGLVGAKLIFGDGKLQEAGGLVWRDGSVWNYGRGGNPRDPRYNYLRETDYCSGACIAIEKRFWDELGGFDEAFAPAYFEDTDLAFRVRAAGKRVLYQPLCEIIHFEGASSGTDTNSGLKRYQKINQPKFSSRWSRDFHGNGMPGDDPDYNKERGYGQRVLVIDTEVPQPDRSAGHYAAIQELRLLQSLGFKPTFLPENLAHLGRYNDQLAEMGVESVYAPFVLSAEEFLRKRGGEFDLIYITRYYVAQNMLDLVRQYCPRAKVVFNNADLHFLRLIRAALGEKTGLKMDEAIKVRDAELDVMRRVDLTFSYSEVEHAVIQSHNLNTTNVAKCPWIVTPRQTVPGFSDRRDIAFLGGFRHPPNEEAVRFFIAEVMPHLRNAVKDIKFQIYGSGVPRELYELGSVDVVINGHVETVDEIFNKCRIFVAPLMSGAGVKGKVLDALACGVPSVLSPLAAEGIGIRDGQEAFIARKPEDWVTKIRRLYLDEKLWSRMSTASLELVRENYSFERGRQMFQEAFVNNNIRCLSGLFMRD